jgi:hypothetical protein
LRLRNELPAYLRPLFVVGYHVGGIDMVSSWAPVYRRASYTMHKFVSRKTHPSFVCRRTFARESSGSGVVYRRITSWGSITRYRAIAPISGLDRPTCV